MWIRLNNRIINLSNITCVNLSYTTCVNFGSSLEEKPEPEVTFYTNDDNKILISWLLEDGIRCFPLLDDAQVSDLIRRHFDTEEE